MTLKDGFKIKMEKYEQRIKQRIESKRKLIKAYEKEIERTKEDKLKNPQIDINRALESIREVIFCIDCKIAGLNDALKIYKELKGGLSE